MSKNPFSGYNLAPHRAEVGLLACGFQLECDRRAIADFRGTKVLNGPWKSELGRFSPSIAIFFELLERGTV